MSRKLVTIRKINALIPIDGCDNICLAVVDGWTVIVKKIEFNVNDYCVFFEIDSFIPAEDTRFQFLKKTTTFEGKLGYRLRTMKMKGVISQGLALPPYFLGLDTALVHQWFKDQTDISDQLNIIKYDVAVQEFDQRPGLKSGRPRGSFPSFIPKTDQEKIQNLTRLWGTLDPNTLFEETLKLDGSSMTCYKIHKFLSLLDKIKQFFGIKVKPYHFGVCSRNLELQPSASNSITFNNDGKVSVYDQSDFWRMAIKLDLESKLPEGYAIQGKLIGPKIQANNEKVTTLEYYVFDVFNIKEQQYLLPDERVAFCAKYNIPHVPVLGKFTPFKLSLQDLLKHVEGQSMNPGTISEGRVYKQIDKPFSFKVISNQYLLKSEQ